jgi:hypothetical protein
MNALEDSASQLAAVAHFLDGLNDKMDRIPARAPAADGSKCVTGQSPLTVANLDRMEVAL